MSVVLGVHCDVYKGAYNKFQLDSSFPSFILLVGMVSFVRFGGKVSDMC
jgi:hypothetical protein